MPNFSKPIIFCDWYGVLSFSHLFEGVDNKTQIEDELFRDSKKLLRAACVDLSDVDLCTIIAERLQLNPQELRTQYLESWQKVTWNQEYLDFLQQFRSDYTLILITDNLESFGTIVAPKISAYFHEIHCSFEVGTLKSNPDNQFFHNTAKKLNSDLSQAILIDDTKINRDIFSQFGHKTFVDIVDFQSVNSSDAN